MNIDERFWKKVLPADTNGCKLWIGSVDKRGYGIFTVNKVKINAHRMSLILTNGQPPFENAVAAHAPHEICGNRHCVAPEHLSWKTHAQNSRDRIRDGTSKCVPSGEKHLNAKLTKNDVLTIRNLYSQGSKQSNLARQFNVSRQQIYNIVHEKNWVTA